MHSAFTDTQFGPFASDYHREAVTDDFKQAFFAFLEAELLPQVEQPYESTSGHLMAAYDNQKYCGPLSLVRDIYRLEFAFHRSSGDDTTKVDLVFDPKLQAFRTRNHRPLYLWTASRRQRHQEERQQIQELCTRIASRVQIAGVCPLCSASLRIIDSPGLFDVSCPERCFNYNYHRDPAAGELLHGHFFQKDTVHAA